MNNISDISKIFEDIIRKNITQIFSSIFLPKLIDVYLETYKKSLQDLEVSSDSLANPEYFFEDYKNALNDFNYINFFNKYEFKFTLPDEDTFNFSGRLTFLNILNTCIFGDFYELPIQDYLYLLNRKDIGSSIKESLLDLHPISDSNNITEFDFLLIDSNIKLLPIVEQILNKKLVYFPFSNQPPIDIFSEGKIYFEDHSAGLINEIISKSIDDLKRGS